ncbi:hypothetical protein PENSPDRAFT_17086 [Peniophora sp. CONT]|nr:hypothetical protein PENSPDRAFT_17086 [Peniophora sp. CONT]
MSGMRTPSALQRLVHPKRPPFLITTCFLQLLPSLPPNPSKPPYCTRSSTMARSQSPEHSFSARRLSSSLERRSYDLMLTGRHLRPSTSRECYVARVRYCAAPVAPVYTLLPNPRTMCRTQCVHRDQRSCSRSLRSAQSWDMLLTWIARILASATDRRALRLQLQTVLVAIIMSSDIWRSLFLTSMNVSFDLISIARGFCSTNKLPELSLPIGPSSRSQWNAGVYELVIAMVDVNDPPVSTNACRQCLLYECAYLLRVPNE